jgi:hypothetical protein
MCLKGFADVTIVGIKPIINFGKMGYVQFADPARGTQRVPTVD